MKWKLTKDGFVQAEDGDRVIKGSPSRRWKKWHKEYEAIKDLSPLQRMQREWEKANKKKK